ncbi:MAG TPA: hypothetical protein VNC12_04065, partial [Solirubrobacteraceae bacterium]|nr:hypothetical protein [Solirubrobacteraceae bacterium]
RPLAGQHYSGPLQIAVAASSPTNGVREITIQLTRHSRVHFVSKGFPSTFRGAMAWQAAKTLAPGPHKIKIIVTDKLGNVATRTISIVHTPSASPTR